jgi:hypothetical protein
VSGRRGPAALSRVPFAGIPVISLAAASRPAMCKLTTALAVPALARWRPTLLHVGCGEWVGETDYRKASVAPRPDLNALYQGVLGQPL